MHYAGAVVTLLELPSKRVVREFSHQRVGRESDVTVFLPFDTEYGFSFKFTDGIRRRLELSIDGAQVADLILSGPKDFLERFLDSDRRFKFVSANHPSVADPTSSENGGIEIKLWREKQPNYYKPLIGVNPFQPQFPGQWYDNQTFGNVTTNMVNPETSILRGGRGSSLGGSDLRMKSQCFSSSSADLSIQPCSAQVSMDSCFAAAPVDATLGATVEGSKSSQTFGTTTWRGDDGAPDIFRFHLKGKVKGESPRKAIECPYCNAFSKSEDRFCSKCGAEFMAVTR